MSQAVNETLNRGWTYHWSHHRKSQPSLRHSSFIWLGSMLGTCSIFIVHWIDRTLNPQWVTTSWNGKFHDYELMIHLRDSGMLLSRATCGGLDWMRYWWLPPLKWHPSRPLSLPGGCMTRCGTVRTAASRRERPVFHSRVGPLCGLCVLPMSGYRQLDEPASLWMWARAVVCL